MFNEASRHDLNYDPAGKTFSHAYTVLLFTRRLFIHEFLELQINSQKRLKKRPVHASMLVRTRNYGICAELCFNGAAFGQNYVPVRIDLFHINIFPFSKNQHVVKRLSRLFTGFPLCEILKNQSIVKIHWWQNHAAKHTIKLR